MMYTNIFFMLSFVVLVIIIISAGNMTNAVLAASLFVNFLSMYNNLVKIDKKESLLGGKMLDDSADAPFYQDYMKEYKSWAEDKATYKNTAAAPISPDNISTNSVDLTNTIMARGRARDKTCIDGMVSKTADFYKFYFGDDFDESERKPWWGRNDY